MINSIQRDQRRRLLFSQFETKQIQHKALLQDALVKNSIKRELSLRMHKIPRNSSKSRVRNRCTLTGRSRGILRTFKMSRIRFRELASQGVLNGVSKASW